MRRATKLLLKTSLGLAVLLLLVLVAWVACNGRWADAAPQPVAAALMLRPVRVAAADNAFVDLQGLEAPAGADINAAGQAALMGQPRDAEGLLGWPQGERWDCRVRERDCVRLWLAQAPAHRQDMDKAALLGSRCERIAQAEALEEVLPQRSAEGPLAGRSFASLPLPRFAGLTACVRWLGMRALLEADDTRALALLAQSDRLARRALAGSRSLIGTMIGLAAVQNSWLVAADVMAARGQNRAALLPLLQPLPQQALSPWHWIPYEAQFGREVIRDMVDPVHGCDRAMDVEGVPSPSWLDRQLCRWALGMLPEQSAQDSDARWLPRLEGLAADGPVPCDTLQARPWTAPRRGPSWRNTLTRWMLDMPDVHWTGYVARQTDLELLRQTLVARIRQQPLPGGVQLSGGADAPRFSACAARLAADTTPAPIRLPAP